MQIFCQIGIGYNCLWKVLISQPAFTCSKLTVETLEQGVKYVQKCEICSGIFIVNFEHISHLVVVFLLLAVDM